MGTQLNARGSQGAVNCSNEWCQTPDPLPLWKRALDLGCLLFMAPALVPVMAFVAIGVRLSSPGHILFRQERIGLRGRPFTLFKFRTMVQCAETKSHQEYLATLIHSDVPMEKLDANDKRVSRFGAMLRASGLDELPQLFNVLRGEMSLVGPRPCIRYEFEQYLPEHRQRLNAVPGLTGLWQVNGKNRTTFPEMVAFDVRYFRTLSLGQDISILFRTFPVVFRQTREALDRKRTRPKSSPPAARPPVSRQPASRPATSV
jgi:lipopolysaccharide/colanic/teichoic acid biosynthesis glycosyltransferase